MWLDVGGMCCGSEAGAYLRLTDFYITLKPRGGLGFKAHRLWYHSTPGLKVIKKEKVGERPASAP